MKDSLLIFFAGLFAGSVLMFAVIQKHENNYMNTNDIFYAAQDIRRDLEIMNIKYKDVKILRAGPVKAKDGYYAYFWSYEYTDEKGLRQTRTGITEFKKGM